MAPTSSPKYLPVSTFCVQVPTWHGLLSVLKNGLIFNDFVAKEYAFAYISGCVFLLCYPTAFTWPVKLCGVLIRFPGEILRWLVRTPDLPNPRHRGNSVASRYQSIYHGGYVHPESPFAGMQSFGATHHESEDLSVPLYASLLQIGVAVLLVRCLFFL